MNPKEVDDSLLGMVQEMEPTLPTRKPKKNKKVSVHPVTGEAVLERDSSRDRKPKVKESKMHKRQAKTAAFWDSLT